MPKIAEPIVCQRGLDTKLILVPLPLIPWFGWAGVHIFLEDIAKDLQAVCRGVLSCPEQPFLPL
jgi:uncharacterized membrane protein